MKPLIRNITDMASDNETCSVCDAPLRSLDFAGMWVCTVCTETVIDNDGTSSELSAIRLTRAQCKRFIEIVVDTAVFTKGHTVVEFRTEKEKDE